MNLQKDLRRNPFLIVGALTLLLAPLLSFVPTPALAQQNCRKVGNFDVCGRFLEEWNKGGNEQRSVYVNGLAITERRAELSLADGKPYETQWFERARFEAHPQNTAPYDVLLGRLGATLSEGRGAIEPVTKRVRNAGDQPFVGIDKPADADGRNKVWFEQTKHSVSGKIKEYWDRYGGLAQFGYPLSEQFQETSSTDGKLYTVQYFERNRFELHPEKQPPYDVELGLLGVQQYKLQAVAANTLPIAPPENVTSRKDSAVIGFSQEPNSLFGLAENTNVALTALGALEHGLVEQDHAGNYYPALALYVPTLENGGSYYVGTGDDRQLVTKYKLRRGQKWSDGNDLDSSDVIYSYKLIMDPNLSIPSRDLWERVNTVDNPDKQTIIYNWLSAKQATVRYNSDKARFTSLRRFVDERRPVVHPLYFMVGSVHPEHILSKIPAGKIIESPFAREGHVGSGPFKLEKWTPGQDMTLVRNEQYTLTAKPQLRRITYRFVTDPNQLIAQLKAGDLDGATSDSFSAPTEALEQLGPGQTVEYVPGRNWENLSFTFTFEPFKDKAVREAIITAINRKRIVDQTYRGRSVVLNTVQPPASWVSTQNEGLARKYPQFKLPAYEYNPQRANQLLDQAGWAKGGDGIRFKEGKRLSFELATNAGNALRQAIMQLVQADLKAVGIDAQPKYYVGRTEYFANAGILDRGVCALCLLSSTLGPDPDFSQWDSAQAPTEENNWSGQNYGRYGNAKVDQLIRQFGDEIDRSKREPVGAEIQQLLMNDVALVPLFPRATIEVHKTGLKNWRTSSGSVPSTYNVSQWYFE